MDTSIASKALVIFVILAGLGMAFFAGQYISEENYFMLSLIIASICGVLFVALSGKRYWMIIPFALSSQLPAIPLGLRKIELGELAIMGCAILFVANIAMKKERAVVLHKLFIPIYLFIGWVAMIYFLNPTGLMIFGSGSIGGRFYFKLFLAFMAFMIMASRDLDERTAKWTVGLFIAGMLIAIPVGIFSWYRGTPGAEPGLDDEPYTWHQVMFWPATNVAALLFAAKRPSEVFSLKNLKWICVYCLCILVVLSSGKRMGVAWVFITPLLSAFLYREYRYVIMGALAAGVVTLIVSVGHAHVFTLPLTMQRALSFIPAEWDERFKGMAGGKDDWRAMLREHARDMAEENPIVGKGYNMDLNTAISANTGSKVGSLEAITYGYAYTRSWHNVWFGYAADFGFPLVAFQCAIWLTILYIGVFVCRSPNALLHHRIIAGFVFIMVVRDLLASQTSGHTALDAYDRWWVYGLSVAAYRAVKELEVIQATKISNFRNAQLSEVSA